MTFNFSKLFKLAHQIAKANRANFASYRDAFAASLKAAWKEARKPAILRPAEMKFTGAGKNVRRGLYASIYNFLAKETFFGDGNRGREALQTLGFIAEARAHGAQLEKGWNALLDAAEEKATRFVETYGEAAEKYTAQLRSEARRDSWRRPNCSFAGNIYA